MTGTARLYSQRLRERGATLIEMLVAITIFSLLLLVVLSIFSRFVLVQRRDVGEQALQEDLRFALELFNREVRTGFGSTYHSDGTQLTLRNQNGLCVSYRVNAERWQRAEAAADEDVNCEQALFTRYEDIVSDETILTHLVFTVVPAAVAESAERSIITNQGVVTVSLRAASSRKAEQTLAVQSTVTSRQVQPF